MASKGGAVAKLERYNIPMLNWLLLFVPLAILAHFLHWAPVLIFGFCAVSIIPLAGLMGRATEYLGERLGEGPGGLLNATFGNACELIIAFSALRAGLPEVVKASITGSIVGNVLLVLGLSIFCGGLRHQTQTFNKTAATTLATLCGLGAISLIVPAVFAAPTDALHVARQSKIALTIAIVLFLTYFASLWFSLKTHHHLFTRAAEADSAADEALGAKNWSVRRSLIVLALSTVLVAILSEILVHTVESAAQTLGMTKLFVGVVLVAIIGNAAEHSTAVLMAMKNRMDLAVQISLGSGAQIALFVAPVLVFASWMLGQPMNLNFTLAEVAAVGLSVLILPLVVLDGECNWLEGLQLLAVYVILSIGFFFI